LLQSYTKHDTIPNLYLQFWKLLLRRRLCFSVFSGPI